MASWAPLIVHPATKLRFHEMSPCPISPFSTLVRGIGCEQWPRTARWLALAARRETQDRKELVTCPE